MPDKEEKKIRMVLVGYGGMGKQYAGMMTDGGIEGLTLYGICCRNQEDNRKSGSGTRTFGSTRTRIIC